MPLTDALNNIDKRYAWSLFGFALAVIFGGITVYTEFIRDLHPRLNFEVISDASVLDVREKLGDLEIIYGGIDIQKAQKSLRVIVIRLTNDGGGDILKSHYDDTSPFGLRILKGTLLRAEILSASSPYLRQTLRINVKEPDTAFFTPVILEAQESFTVKSLIVHSEGVRPEIEPIGKIAGIRQIHRTGPADLSADLSFLVRSFSGSPAVQIARLLAYFLAVIGLIIGIAVPSISIADAVSKRRRRTQVTQFKTHTKLNLIDKDEFIFERYIQHDMIYLQQFKRAALAGEKRLNRWVKNYEKHVVMSGKHDRAGATFIVGDSQTGRNILMSGNPRAAIFYGAHMPIEEMKRAAFIVKTGDTWHVDPHLKETVEEFIRFLDIKRAR